MPKKILLVGHCGADSSYLRSAIRAADKDATPVFAEDADELHKAVEAGVDLVLFNRELGYGFDEKTGVDLIREIKSAHPEIKTMLVSNYPDVQAAAIAAGALPGFGKRELGKPRVVEILRNALTG